MNSILLVTIIVIIVIILIFIFANHSEKNQKRRPSRKTSKPSRHEIRKHVNQTKKTPETYFNGEDEIVVTSERHLVGLTPTVYTVPSVSYPTIQSAIDAAKALGDPGYLRIQIAPGTYDEFITIEGFDATPNFTVRNFNQGDVLVNDNYPGFQILGDSRPYMGFSYANGYERAGNSLRGVNYIITTNNAGGPYNAQLSATFGAIGGITNLNAQVANPIIACSPLTNTGLNGQVAIIRRGTCGFANKALIAQNAGAAAAIIFNNVPGGPIVGLGGVNFAVNIPVYSLSNADGLALSAAVNASTVITATPINGAYNPPLGTNYGMVQLTHPGGDRSKITVTITSAPLADDNILATPVIDQPIFDSPSLGIEPNTTFNPSGLPGIIPGDFVVVSDADIVFSNTAKSLHQITAVSGNTITFSPPIPTVGSGGVDITGLGANITFLPNVRLTKSFPFVPGQLSRPIFRASSVGFSATGLWIDQHPSVPAGVISIGFTAFDCVTALANIIVTDVRNTTSNGFGISIADAHCYCTDGYRDSSTERHMAVIGWSRGIELSSMAELNAGHIFVSNTIQNTMSMNYSSNANLFSLRIYGSQNIYQANNTACALGESNLTVSKIFHVTDSYGPGLRLFESEISVENPGIRVERCYNPVGDTTSNAGAVVLSKNSRFAVLAGDFLASDGELISQYTLTSIFKDNNDITPLIGPGFSVPQIAINNRGGIVKFAGQVIYENNDLNILNEVDAIYSSPDDDLSPENVLQVAAPGILDSVFEKQRLETGASLIEFDPSTIFNQDYLYVGKSFLLYSDNQAPHCLRLTSGTFLGLNPGKVIKFHKKPGAYVKFTVVSPTQVLIEEHHNISCSDSC